MEGQQSKSKTLDFAIDPIKANLIVLIPSIASFILFFALYRIVNGFKPESGTISFKIDVAGMLLVVFWIFVLGFLHEAIHALGFVYFGNVSWKDIKIGVWWRKLTPYAHCKTGVSINAYRISGMLPVIIGIIPLLLDLYLKEVMVYFIGMIMFIACYGDFLGLWLLRDVPRLAVVYDHTEKLGCKVFISE